jgi:hypothetical protein
MDTSYKRPRKRSYRAASTPFGATIPGSKGVRIEGARDTSPRRHPGDMPLSPKGRAYKDKLAKETEISLRDHPERWRLKTVNDTKHYQSAPYEERRRARSG